jgi:hypothetical protein
MSRTRDISKILSSGTDLITTAELSSELTSYLTNSSASTIYATQESLATIDADNNPDIFLLM